MVLTTCHHPAIMFVKLKTRLKDLRTERKLSQGQVAMRVGVHRSYIAKIEHGQRMPGRDLLFRLANIFGCRVDDLIAFDPDERRRS